MNKNQVASEFDNHYFFHPGRGKCSIAFFMCDFVVLLFSRGQDTCTCMVYGTIYVQTKFCSFTATHCDFEMFYKKCKNCDIKWFIYYFE